MRGRQKPSRSLSLSKEPATADAVGGFQCRSLAGSMIRYVRKLHRSRNEVSNHFSFAIAMPYSIMLYIQRVIERKLFVGHLLAYRLVSDAIDEVSEYLAASGRDGEFYRDALALLDEDEEMRISGEETCAGKTQGASCWMELANHPQCYVWNQNYEGSGETATWPGNRSGVFAHGQGELRFTVGDREIQWRMGHLERGRYHGQWLIRHSDGTKEKGEYVHDKREGRWLAFLLASPAGERCKSATYQGGNRVVEWRNVDGSECDY